MRVQNWDRNRNYVKMRAETGWQWMHVDVQIVLMDDAPAMQRIRIRREDYQFVSRDEDRQPTVPFTCMLPTYNLHIS